MSQAAAAPTPPELLFKSILYMKKGCPYCTKLAVFLADAKLQDIYEWQYDTEENRAKITKKLGKCSFPCVQYAKDEFMLETNDIISSLVVAFNVDTTKLPAYLMYCSDDNGISFFTKFTKMFGMGMTGLGGYPQILERLFPKKVEEAAPAVAAKA
mmetsp:Transcript_27988/g.47046  ORF Transcript_27988/g.47046 Transcript_27988/m.47046 type:complete len:155 (-) Transcript_27988:171-635(-)|eukprot:CAMPEP_0174989788 /NCGR_PEP_ID=MMETSP0004_2-20121128/20929_1 /TAXON_ID=420556 /ORGANISM="Ochromonas sp., Strain CCMP1393" /LENGTH=154 /DNA_ID=CAMNT_0016243261 /DNA_START=108 /DNA_END=572 /DNA_ORIENTATION=+